MKRLTTLCALAALLLSGALAAAQPLLVPKPVSAHYNDARFTADAQTRILYPAKDAELQRLAGLLGDAIASQCGLRLRVEPLKNKKTDNSIRLQLGQDAGLGEEGYSIDVEANTVLLTAPTARGLFYGIQTVRQFFPYEPASQVSIRGTSIRDYPRFEWRGMLLDGCRHLISVDYIKWVLDEMAYHKLNKLHWHLTDDQGWRIEIKKYPKLTEIGAWRNGTQYGPDRRNDVDTLRYGGFYTQEQIKEVVAYAASRNIEVIPEIEMPGHSVAAITAYNYLACGTHSFETGGPFEVRKTWGVSKDLLCAGNEQVYAFLQDVLTEVMVLFPSKYIHVGGDEAPHDAWKQCPKCQQRINAEGLHDEMGLQHYLVRRIERFLTDHNKEMIGWEEIMGGDLAPTSVVMSWLGTSSGVRAAKRGARAIMCPYEHLYYDGYQASPAIEPLAVGYDLPLEKAYRFEPYHPSLTEQEQPLIMGVQANMWTEFISTSEQFEYLLYPRVCAVSEIAWSPRGTKDWEQFKALLGQQMKRWHAAGIRYRIPVPEAPAYLFVSEGDSLKIANSWAAGEIRYTTDGTEPTPASPLYTAPIAPPAGSVVRSAVFLPDGRRSSVWNTLVRAREDRSLTAPIARPAAQ